MIVKYIEEFGRYVGITGFRGVKLTPEKLDAIFKIPTGNDALQFFNARYIAGWEHLFFATVLALYAFKNRTNISKKVGIEILIYASAEKQINKAIKKLGISASVEDLAVVMLSEDIENINRYLEVLCQILGKKEDDENALRVDDKKVQDIIRCYQITDLELEAHSGKNPYERLLECVVDRMAVLSTASY